MTGDIAAFLAARLDEDEAAAEKAAEPWSRRVLHSGSHEDTVHVWAHVGRHDPARVLREVAAKRAILDLHKAAAEHDDTSLGVATLRAVIRALTAVYSDHPDYQRATLAMRAGS